MSFQECLWEAPRKALLVDFGTKEYGYQSSWSCYRLVCLLKWSFLGDRLAIRKPEICDLWSWPNGDPTPKSSSFWKSSGDRNVCDRLRSLIASDLHQKRSEEPQDEVNKRIFFQCSFVYAQKGTAWGAPWGRANERYLEPSREDFLPPPCRLCTHVLVRPTTVGSEVLMLGSARCASFCSLNEHSFF